MISAINTNSQIIVSINLAQKTCISNNAEIIWINDLPITTPTINIDGDIYFFLSNEMCTTDQIILKYGSKGSIKGKGIYMHILIFPGNYFINVTN